MARRIDLRMLGMKGYNYGEIEALEESIWVLEMSLKFVSGKGSEPCISRKLKEKLIAFSMHWKWLFFFSSVKFNPLEEENMKAVLAAEKKADDIEKRLTENVEELQGVEKVI